MHSRLAGSAVVGVLAAVFAVAWHHHLWLVVVAMAAGAVTLVACELLAARMSAQRAAAWALYDPSGIVEGDELERAIAADLATSTATTRPVAWWRGASWATRRGPARPTTAAAG